MDERRNQARGANEWKDVYGDMGQRPRERRMPIPIELLDFWQYPDGRPQPFTPYTEAELRELARDIEENGLNHSILVRPMPNGRFQVVAGEHRTKAHQLLGRSVIDATVRDMDDLTAEACMLSSNLKVRKGNKPSDTARVYKALLDVQQKRISKGQRTDLTLPKISARLDDEAAGATLPKISSRLGDEAATATLPKISARLDDEAAGATLPKISSRLGDEAATATLPKISSRLGDEATGATLPKISSRLGDEATGATLPKISSRLVLHSDDEAAKSIGISGDTLRNYIRLLDLIKPMLDMVDDGQIPVSAGFELAYLFPADQQRVLDLLPEGRKISVAQAKKLRKAAPLTSDAEVLRILGIVKEKKKAQLKLQPKLLIPEEDVERLSRDPDFLLRAEKLIASLAREYLNQLT